MFNVEKNVYYIGILLNLLQKCFCGKFNDTGLMKLDGVVEGTNIKETFTSAMYHNASKARHNVL